MRHLNKIGVLLTVMLMAAIGGGFTGCDVDPDSAEAVVSDGVTDADLPADRQEVLPSVTVYRVLDKDRSSFAKYLLSGNIQGLEVVFRVRRFSDSEWIRMGDEVLYTDENGRATLPEIRRFLPRSILEEAPVDLQLQARIYFNDADYISDDKGIIRVLSSDKNENPSVVFTDHDNTLHATGGPNAPQDWIDFLNWAGDDWPLVDEYVVSALNELRSENRDIVIVSGLLNGIRSACREQVNRHFENGGQRFIPLILQKDFPYEETNIFKKEALRVLKDLYGSDNCPAMVGDTVRQDGYGAVANGIHYVPFQIHYDVNAGLLDTWGYGPIDPAAIADNWRQVLDAIHNGPVIEDNFFLKRFVKCLNIGHRGGGSLLPENTLQAYRNAYAVGADSIEGDVYMTSDGVIVVSHDETVDRCTNGTGKIEEMSLAQIKALDAGYRFTPDDGMTYPYRGMGFQIPTLEEVFSDPVLDRGPMVLEIKQSGLEVTERVLDLIQTYGMENQLIVGAFDQDTVDLIGELSAARGMDLVLICATKEVLEFIATPRNILAGLDHDFSGQVLALPQKLVSPLVVRKAWSLGMKVYVWTVNEESDMIWERDAAKVDGILTDNPELLESVLNP